MEDVLFLLRWLDCALAVFGLFADYFVGIEDGLDGHDRFAMLHWDNAGAAERFFSSLDLDEAAGAECESAHIRDEASAYIRW